MRHYLRWINPGLAAVVLALCFWAATFGERKTFDVHGLVAGGMQTYFFAKGLFSASAMFFLGRILLEVVSRGDHGRSLRPARRDIAYALGFAGLVLGILAGLLLDMKNLGSPKQAAPTPGGLVIVEHYRVKESKDLRVSGKVRNTASDARSRDIEVRFYIDGKFATYCRKGDGVVPPGSEAYFSVACPELEADRVPGEVTYEIATEGKDG